MLVMIGKSRSEYKVETVQGRHSDSQSRLKRYKGLFKSGPFFSRSLTSAVDNEKRYEESIEHPQGSKPHPDRNSLKSIT